MSAPSGPARAAHELARLGRVVWPGLVRGARGIGRGTRAGARFAHRHRAALRATVQRGVWWSALLLLVVGGRTIVGTEAVPPRAVALLPFVVGLALCAGLRLGSSRAHLRAAALGLGALHGTAAVLVWLAFGG